MATTQRVRPTERHNLLIVESHAVEDVAQVLRCLRGVGQAVAGRVGVLVEVGAAGVPRDGGAAHFLDGNDAGESPEVGVGLLVAVEGYQQTIEGA